MRQLISLLVITFFAVFTQSLAGFGSGLVSMVLMPNVLSIRTAVPLVAMLTGTIEVVLLLRYRSAFRIASVWRLCLASVIFIPIGVVALRQVSERVLLPILGIVMVGFAVHSLSKFNSPRLEHPLWAYVAGIFSGLLSGAYSVGGPPVIIYGHCRGWKPDEFKVNLQGFFLVNDFLAVIAHGIAGNITPQVIKFYVWVFPAMILGLVIGTSLDRIIDPAVFRKFVLILLIIMGFRLMMIAF